MQKSDKESKEGAMTEHITTPLAGFNGGLITDANFHFLDEKTIKDDLIEPVSELLGERIAIENGQ